MQVELGPQALKDYSDMSHGQLICSLPNYLEIQLMALAPGLQMQTIGGGRSHTVIEGQDQEEIFLAFDRDSPSSTPWALQRLGSDSRAAAAGVREVDLITSNISWMSSAED